MSLKIKINRINKMTKNKEIFSKLLSFRYPSITGGTLSNQLHFDYPRKLWTLRIHFQNFPFKYSFANVDNPFRRLIYLLV